MSKKKNVKVTDEFEASLRGEEVEENFVEEELSEQAMKELTEYFENNNPVYDSKTVAIVPKDGKFDIVLVLLASNTGAAKIEKVLETVNSKYEAIERFKIQVINQGLFE